MKKLTDEQLSRVLSQHANEQMHQLVYGRIGPDGDRGCVAGVALCLGMEWGGYAQKTNEAAVISDAMFTAMGDALNYPRSSDDMLRLLEKAGLA